MTILVKYTPPRIFQDTLFFTAVVKEMLSQISGICHREEYLQA